jgi:zinc protease
MKRLLLAGLLALGAVPAAAQSAPVSDVAVPALQPTHRVLKNGLRVFAIRDDSSPNVSVQVWYGVGSKDDPAGRSGFAHLFEHLMFKATRNLPSESFDRMTEDVGGYNNASTADDYTNYFEVVPANYLHTLIWAEAERMGALVVDEAAFKSERDVVKEELRQRILAQPYGKLFGLYASQIAFNTSPYGRPGIGSIEDLDSASLADVQAFHAVWYRPDNAVLVVAGRFDPAELDRWIDDSFGKLAAPRRPLPAVAAAEPKRTTPKSWTVYEPNTPLPAVLISYPFPGASSADIPALYVADAILSKGESSRLYQSMVYEKPLAQQAFSSLDLRRQPGSYAVGAILADGVSAEQGETALRAQVAKLRDSLVSDAELEEAKTELVTDALKERETVDGKASLVAQAVMVYGDVAQPDRMLAQIQAVTAADVQRVAKTWLADEGRAVLRYLSDADKPKDAPTYGTAATVRTQPLVRPADVVVVAAAPEAERLKPPAPGEPVSISPPTPVEQTLPNGLRVVISPDHDLPLVSARLVVEAGGATDPVGRPGVADMSVSLLTKGTKTRSAVEIARQVEALGADLSGAASYDGSALGLSVRRDKLDAAGVIFADVARNPAFAKEELERIRRQSLDGLQVSLKDPAEVAGYAAARAVYGAAPYGAPLSGTPASLASMTREDVARFHKTWWRPDRATLVLAGDLSPEEGFALAERLFGDWARPATPAPALPDPAGPAVAPRVIAVDLPEAGQAAVTLTSRSIARSDPRYYPAVVGASVLGGGYSARLNQEIRVKRGLSYGASAGIAARRAPGVLIATTQTKNESAAEVVDLIGQGLASLGAEPVGAAELDARKATLIGGFGRTIETTDGAASVLGGLALNHVALGEIAVYADKVKAVTAADIQAVAPALFDPAMASVVVVGDVSKFGDAVKAKHPTLEVIPEAKFSLDTANSVK